MKKRRTSIPAIILTVIVAAAFVAVALVLAAYIVWDRIADPEVSFLSTAVTMEAGTKYDPMAVIGGISGMPGDHVEIDLTGLNSNVPGEYDVVYTIDTFPLSKETLSTWHLSFISPPKKVQTVKVTVEDTTPPAIQLVKEPVRVKRGDGLKIEDVVLSVRDASDVDTTFSDGTKELRFDEDGEFEIEILSGDSFGNISRKRLKTVVYGRDIMPPTIEGVDELILKVGEDFDLMAGVSATDNKDGAVEVTMEAADVSTAQTGRFDVVYTAKDEAGNVARVTRNVAVYEETAGEGDLRFGLLWNNAASADQPYLAAVNRVKNVVTIYSQDGSGYYNVPEKAFVCSIGDATPTGYFFTGERYRWHDLQEQSFGQYATRITGHILFHSVPYFKPEDPSSLEYEEYNKLGTFASLGCVRMCVADCKWVFENCPNGFPCVIYDDDLSDGPLGKPETIKIDVNNEVLRGWDPTDPDPANPWISELK